MTPALSSRASSLVRAVPFVLATSMWMALVPVAVAGLMPAPPAQQLPSLTEADYGQWESVGQATLSPNGTWLAVDVRRVNEENELRIHRTDSDSVVAVPFGSRAAFSKNGRWLAYIIGVSPDEREAMAKRDEPVKNALGLFDLAAGTEERVEAIASYSFSDDGRFLALTRAGQSDAAAAAGSDVIVRDLDQGTSISFGNVGALAWQDDGQLLAMLVDAEDDVGNGVRLYHAGTGRISMLDAADTEYGGLTWRDDAPDLAVLRQHPDEAYDDTAHVVLAWRELDRDRPSSFVLPVDEPLLLGMRVTEYRVPEWSDDGEGIFLGLQERSPVETEPVETAGDGEEGDIGEGEENQEAADKDDDDDPPGVEIWHSLDLDPVPQQKVRERQLRRVNHVAVWHLDSDGFLLLGGDHADRSQSVGGGTHLLARDETPYDHAARFGMQRYDMWVVDATTGERTMAREAVAIDLGPSPDGKYLLWFEGDDFWTHEIATGENRNITAALGGTFVDLDLTPTREQMPPFGVAGWTDGDESVLVNDRFDVWSVSPDGSGGRRLTTGEADAMRYRLLRVDPEADAINPDEQIYFSVYGEWTKKSGFARLDDLDDSEPETLLWEDASISRLLKAEDSDTYAYVSQRWDDSPDFLVAGPDLDNARQVTRTNPFQADFAWGHSELIEYHNEWGRPLQGMLVYPANYAPDQDYPMIVYHYEKLSQGLHRYRVPSPEDYYNPQVWSQEGYFVFMPDIVYRDRRPGQSNVETLRPAVAAALQGGTIDEEKIGLIGHSWGGYQTTFFVTQDDLFASAVAGAPLTNLMSMYLSFYWNSGGTDARIFEISQGRMQVPWWEDWDSYHANSPVHHIENLNTPLLIEFGTDDGAVEFNQGVEFYNAARRAGKHVVMLVYEGENHGLAQDANRKDYASRILQWFGHYLKGEPAPDWIAKGVPYLEQKDGLKKGRKIIG